jgi:3'-5' exonuclease
MGEHVIVCDLETIPDLAAFAAANGLEGKSDAEIRDAMGNKFPKHIYHSIVCIGALVAERRDNLRCVIASGAPHIGERSEKLLIEDFVNKISELQPQLVTFNGNSFDLPVLRYRAMLHRVSAPGLLARSYFNRYSEDTLDLCDVLASFNSQSRATLHEICRALGLPGKPDSVDGGSVEMLYRAGRINEIAEYCETDVVNTYRVWLRYELFRGRLSHEGFLASEDNLIGYIRDRVSKKHLARFL